MEGLLILIAIFNYSFGFLFSHITGIDQSLTLRAIAVFSLIFSVIEYQKSLSNGTTYHSNSVIKRMLVLYALILAGMGITVLIEGYTPDMMKTYLLSYGTKALSGVFLGYAFVNGDLIKKIGRWLEPFCLFYTIATLIAVLNNAGGTAMTLDINRQTLSYIGAYSFALVLFLNFNWEKIEKFKFFSFSIWKYVNYLILFVDIYVIFAGAGRGAFILAALVLIYYIKRNIAYLDAKKILGGIAFVILLFISIKFISESNNVSGGYNIVMNTFANKFSDRSSLERIELWKKSYQYAKSTVFLGGGAGATAYAIGFYTHNIFVDILVEYGIVGVIISLLVFVRSIIKGLKTSVEYEGQEFCLIVFLCAFVMLLFSGSWYSEGALWLGVMSILAYDGTEYRIGEGESFEQGL